jgi:hypothetical protein
MTFELHFNSSGSSEYCSWHEIIYAEGAAMANLVGKLKAQSYRCDFLYSMAGDM